MIALRINAFQSVQLFGLKRQPILTLSWSDVKVENFTWRFLRSLDIPAQDLHKMQPDKHEWLQRGGVCIEDLKDMHVFPVNPLTDFAVDLAELWNMQLSVEEMVKMGITYEQLVHKGISPGIMTAFHFPLSAWASLGFRTEHAACMQEAEVQMIFALGRDELMQILKDYHWHETSPVNSVVPENVPVMYGVSPGVPPNCPLAV